MKLRLPLRDPNERLDAKSIGSLPRVLEGEDRAVCRELFAQCHRVGMRRVGDVHAFLEALGPIERKGLLAALRRRAGLKPTKPKEPKVKRVPSTWSEWQTCPACGSAPVNPYTGILEPVTVRRWWCPAHRHLAGPEDLRPYRSNVERRLGGALVEVNEVEVERELLEAEIRRRRHEDEMRRRRLVVEQSEAEQAARDEAFRSELPPGIPG